MQENRSFDHYFHDLAKFGQPAADVTPKGYLNPDPKSKQDVAPYHATALCGRDTRHDWNSAHKQFNDGKMDGFVSTSNPKGRRALGYYDATDLNYYYALANTFSIGEPLLCVDARAYLAEPDVLPLGFQLWTHRQYRAARPYPRNNRCFISWRKRASNGSCMPRG
jgi:hypothetical protein